MLVFIIQPAGHQRLLLRTVHFPTIAGSSSKPDVVFVMVKEATIAGKQLEEDTFWHV